jgi:hypothetical protein
MSCLYFVKNKCIHSVATSITGANPSPGTCKMCQFNTDPNSTHSTKVIDLTTTALKILDICKSCEHFDGQNIDKKILCGLSKVSCGCVQKCPLNKW